jgi:hypothetical protein
MYAQLLMGVAGGAVRLTVTTISNEYPEVPPGTFMKRKWSVLPVLQDVLISPTLSDVLETYVTWLGSVSLIQTWDDSFPGKGDAVLLNVMVYTRVSPGYAIDLSTDLSIVRFACAFTLGASETRSAKKFSTSMRMSSRHNTLDFLDLLAETDINMNKYPIIYINNYLFNPLTTAWMMSLGFSYPEPPRLSALIFGGERLNHP